MRNIEKQQNPTWLKTAFTGITIISCLISSNTVSAFTQVGSGELIVGATARVGHDSNIFGNSIGGGIDDSFFSIVPELRFVKEDSRSTINARIATDFTRYNDRSDEDFENFYSSIDISLPTGQGSPLSGDIQFGFDSINDTNLLINDRIISDTFSGSANLTYNISSKTGLRGGFLYTNSQNGGGFSDTTTSLVSAGVQYNYSSKAGLFIDGRLRTTESEGVTSVDNRSKGFTVGLTGELSPRLEGSISAGYQSTDARGNIAGDSDSDQFIAFADLIWTPQEKTNVVLTLGRDMDVSPGNESVETTSARVQINHEISRALSLFGGVEIRSLDFRNVVGRKDDVSEFNGGILYSINPRFSAGIEASLFDSSSNEALSDYDREVYSFFVSFSY